MKFFMALCIAVFLSGCMTIKLDNPIDINIERAKDDFSNQETKGKIAYKYADEKFVKFNQFRYTEDSRDYSKGIVSNIDVVKQGVFSIADITLKMSVEKGEMMKTIRCYVPPVDGIYQMDLNNIFMAGKMMYFQANENNLAIKYLVLH